MADNIQIQKVCVRLGSTVAVEDVSVELPSGKIVGLIGPSGAGKTTLIRAIVGRQHLDKGSITIAGQPAGSPLLRNVVRYMTQEASIYTDLTVQENLAYFAMMSGIARRKRRASITSVLETVALAPQAKQLAGSLSGGQKQRLSLAITLLGDPQFLILDEPTVGLDPVLREQLWRLFGKLAAQGKTLIISSHVMDEAERCDDLLLIREAKLLAHGSPHELCQRTHSKSVEESFLKLVGETA